MRKILLIMAVFAGCISISYGADVLLEIQPVSLQLIEPVELQHVPYLEVPKPTLSEEKIKELKEKEALPSIEDIQAKEENTSELERKTQSAVTDVLSDEDYNSEDVIEFIPTKIIKENKTPSVSGNEKKLYYGSSQNTSEQEVEERLPIYPQINSGSIYKL